MRTKPTTSAKAASLRARAETELKEFGAKREHSPIMSAIYHGAKARLRKRRTNHRSESGDPKSAAAPHRLLHELEVHQIELEIQNAELMNARDELEVSLEKYTDLYDFAPVGYFTLAEDGTIHLVNLTGACLAGIERSRLVGRSFGLLISAELRPAFNSFLKQIFAGPTKQSGDFELLIKGQPPRSVNIEAQRLLNGQECRAAVVDITGRKQAEVAATQLAAIVNYSRDAIIGRDLNGLVTSWNDGAENIFGYSASEMVGGPISRLMPSDRKQEEAETMTRIRNGESLQHFETSRVAKDGRLLDVSVTISPIKNAAGKILGASKVARDITERKQAEELLRRSEALFTALVAQAPVGVYVVDGQLCLRQVNPKALTVFRKVRRLIGRDFSEVMRVIWPRRVADQIVERFRNTLNTGEPYQSLLFSERRRDIGVAEVYEWQIQRVTLPAGEHGVVCFFNNITERKRAEGAQRRIEVLAASNRKLEQEIVRRRVVEKALKQSKLEQDRLLEQSRQLQEQRQHLARQVLLAQEEERKRISRELHDVIAQTLTGINVRLAALTKGAALNSRGLQRDIAQTQRLVERSVKVIHDFARELRPSVLDDLGLIPALHTFLKQFREETGLQVSMSAAAAVEQVNGDKRTVLYRVAQEALSNIARHAQASSAEVKILKLDGAIRMTISDDGKGFPLGGGSQAKKHKRLGLLGMRERVEMVRGSFAVQSAPGKGTTVVVQIPLAEVRGGGGGGGFARGVG